MGLSVGVFSASAVGWVAVKVLGQINKGFPI